MTLELGVDVVGLPAQAATTDREIPLFSPSASSISILGRHFVDQHGRVLLLRGANVGAASKVPNEHGLTKPEEASYIGRPFPLSEAAEHWARLKSWGLTFVRIIFTWDAVEHAGPGQYDTEYLAYLRDLLISLRGTGLVAYVSLHQDVWSRYSGGSGAPAWTMAAAGFDMANGGVALEESGAAWLGGVKGGRLEGERGLWPTGYQKLACASMNTFFWGGETFAPSLKVGDKGMNIQTYLQDAFLSMWSKVIDAVGDLDTVMGFEMMNEPHSGYIGLPTIDEWNYNTDLHLGEYPSPLQSFALGAGHPTDIPFYVRSWPHPTRVGRRMIANKGGVKAWTIPCPWQKEGVWSWSASKKRPVALREDYFTKNAKGEPVQFYADFYYPFIRRWERIVAAKAGKKARLLEPIPNEFAPDWPEDSRPKNFVYAPHWYDLNALFSKAFGTMTVDVQSLSRGGFLPNCLYFGKSVRENYRKQIRNIKNKAAEKLGDVPVVIGECGIPFDINNAEAFKTGDWKWQTRMFDALMFALESNAVNFNLWNYNPGNRDDVGDDWNSENFSWFSEENRRREIATAPVEQQAAMWKDLDVGGRLLDVLVRPYAIATAGTPVAFNSSAYEPSTATFTHRFTDVPQSLNGKPPSRARVTEIFLPRRHYKEGQVKWVASGGGRVHFDWARERLFLWYDDHVGAVQRGKPLTRRIDIWVRDTPDRANTVEIVSLTIVVAAVLFFLANEWVKYSTGEGWVEFSF